MTWSDAAILVVSHTVAGWIGFARGKQYTLNVVKLLAAQNAERLAKQAMLVRRYPQPIPHSERRQ